jgi:hypothetical protein
VEEKSMVFGASQLGLSFHCLTYIMWLRTLKLDWPSGSSDRVPAYQI